MILVKLIPALELEYINAWTLGWANKWFICVQERLKVINKEFFVILFACKVILARPVLNIVVVNLGQQIWIEIRLLVECEHRWNGLAIRRAPHHELEVEILHLRIGERDICIRVDRLLRLRNRLNLDFEI